ncbi:MAG: DUF308 domain-containing protein [Clostridium sp.]|nr:DUF308 domain-containing protein [Clostridium sp.]
MESFSVWLLLVFGVWFTISGVIGLCDDVRNRQSAKWWRWVMDPLGLIVGVWFLCEFFLFH